MESAIQDLKWLEKRFKGIVELIPELESVSSLKNMKAELESAIVNLKKDVESIKIMRIEEDKELVKIRKMIASEQEEAQKLYKQYHDKAKADAVDIVLKANMKSASIAEEAQEKIKKSDEQYNESREQLSAVNSAVADAKQELSKITQEIDSLKKKFSR